MADIAATLQVSKSSVSLWVRDVDFEPNPRRSARRRGPNVLQRRKAEQIATLRSEGRARLGALSDQAFLAAGVALYAGEGSKRDGDTMFANTDPRMVAFFCRWLRRFFDIDETRLTARLYLHEGLDLDEAERFWSEVTGIPQGQFRKPFRAVADSSIRSTKHRHGCAYVRYGSVAVHREIMGLMAGLLGS